MISRKKFADCELFSSPIWCLNIETKDCLPSKFGPSSMAASGQERYPNGGKELPDSAEKAGNETNPGTRPPQPQTRRPSTHSTTHPSPATNMSHSCAYFEIPFKSLC
jgi:hypothetical protein